ncbi:Menaquinone via futalosine polyprenyltransferase (MenA homolog) [hydrothermal vent metagenome]|uniref:Menaquinone via futalosine polyprenyltransferase (MenA homolog) n=1 Tax=hydrothermal vent metagenome TaxID=652676 RepID=A0A3B1DCN7_9ZZZZ
MELIRRLLELIRFSHTIFALPFALLAAFLAWQEPSVSFRWQDFIGILLCMIFARSAAMAFNRLVDQNIDAQNERTAVRHLPAGLLSRRVVIFFTLFCSVGFVASTLLFFPHRLPLYLSVPVLLFLLGYSYAKRWTFLCHYWLSTALMLSPIAAWIAITGKWGMTPLLLAAVIFFWVGGFDILYACQDIQFDNEQKLHSIPSKFGMKRAFLLAAISHLFTVLCLFAFWYVAGLGIIFLVGIIAVTLLLIYEHAIIKPTDLSRVNIAFFQVNAIISIGLLAVGIIDVLLR